MDDSAKTTTSPTDDPVVIPPTLVSPDAGVMMPDMRLELQTPIGRDVTTQRMPERRVQENPMDKLINLARTRREIANLPRSLPEVPRVSPDIPVIPYPPGTQVRQQEAPGLLSRIGERVTDVMDGAKLYLFAATQFGSVIPLRRDGEWFVLIKPSADVQIDPRQRDEELYTGVENKYYPQFKHLKEQGVKRIDVQDLPNGSLPAVHLNDNKLRLLDHNRILGARAAKIPIVARVDWSNASYN